jgi:hypothetical protein
MVLVILEISLQRFEVLKAELMNIQIFWMFCSVDWQVVN